ncbi:MAG: c-type cytochrome [Bacteroidetes bacterium]|nr:c-type cytochrome [Bacteroidota bacterium]
MKRIFFIGILICSMLTLSSLLSKPSDAALMTPESTAALGKLLFFDPILSQDKSISCASCHKPEFAYADTVAFSNGVAGNKTTRNVPSAMNMMYRDIYFWDGRANTLEEQAIFPIENPVEMNLKIGEAIKRLNASPSYVSYFKLLYNEKPNKKNLALALASFERTLETSATPFDKFAKGDSSAISESAKRGQLIFNQKGHCFDCHFGPDFTGDEFKNIGLYNEKELNDAGRFSITKNGIDKGKFKVPGLRNVAVTAPYMHNGMFTTLREVIDYYSEPEKFVKGGINTDPITAAGFHLTEQEKQDIEAFLISLTDSSFALVK